MPGAPRRQESGVKPDADTLAVEVWRGDARGGGYVAYRVPRRESQTVLDVVTWIQQHAEPALAYRFACRVGMCGSCAMTVNGRPRWTCRTHVARVARAAADLAGLAPRPHAGIRVSANSLHRIAALFGNSGRAVGPAGKRSMTVKFIHTSDWQIGKVFRFVDDATMGLLQEARLRAISRLDELAGKHGADRHTQSSERCRGVLGYPRHQSTARSGHWSVNRL